MKRERGRGVEYLTKTVTKGRKKNSVSTIKRNFRKPKSQKKEEKRL